MLETLVGLAVAAALAWVARDDEQSPVLWFIVALAWLVVFGLVLATPYLRVLVAAAATFACMVAYKRMVRPEH